MELFEIYKRAIDKGYRIGISQAHNKNLIIIELHKGINKELITSALVFDINDLKSRELILMKYRKAEREFLQRVAEYEQIND